MNNEKTSSDYVYGCILARRRLQEIGFDEQQAMSWVLNRVNESLNPLDELDLLIPDERLQ